MTNSVYLSTDKAERMQTLKTISHLLACENLASILQSIDTENCTAIDFQLSDEQAESLIEVLLGELTERTIVNGQLIAMKDSYNTFIKRAEKDIKALETQIQSLQDNESRESLETAEYLVKEAIEGLVHQEAGNWLSVAKDNLVIALSHLKVINRNFK